MMEMIELSEICDLQNGYAFKSNDYVDFSNTLNCRMSNIRPEGYFDIDYAPKYLPDIYADKYSQFKLNDGDLVIAMTDMANDPKILGVPTIVKTKGQNVLLNQRVGKLIFKKPGVLDVRFLQYYLNQSHVRKYYTKFAGGGLQLNLGKKEILSVKIPLPPLSEQKRIAELLDAADTLRKKDKALLEKYDQLAQSLFLEMFGDPVKNEKGWEVKKLGDVISKLETGVSVNSTDEKFNGNSFGILKTSCVYTGEFREMEAKVILENEISRAKLNPKKDSLIVSRMNTSELVGKSAYVDKDYPNLFLPDRLWQTVPGSSDCNFRWLHYVLNHSSFMDSISKIASGTSGSMKNISKQSFLNLVCIYPNFSLQNQFAEQVQLIEKQKEIAKKNLEKSEELMKGFLGSVFG